MHSDDGRFVIVFNGEIYNYRELRAELSREGHPFHTDSDTEVLLAAWRVWGRTCLPRLLGMFAFVVFDRNKQVLTCVRDAFGIKPFFYSCDDGEFLFASEMNALLGLRSTAPSISWQRSYDYLTQADYDSQEQSFMEGVKHLMPGCIMEFDLPAQNLSTQAKWWQPSIQERADLSFKQAAEQVREQFLQNIRLHLRSDVPLGAALSGGIDSSAVVCAMRHLVPDAPIYTFSYIARGSPTSEECWVDRVNAYTGAHGFKVEATGAELAQDLDDLIAAQGEPFGSTSIYAQYRVFKLAKESGITVTLDGQGADELLAGYNGHPSLRMKSLIDGGHYVRAFAFADSWRKWPGRNSSTAIKSLGSALLPERLHGLLKSRMHKERYMPPWLDIDLLREAGVRLGPSAVAYGDETKGRSVVGHLASSLQHRGLPELLRHGDRNSMRFSIESRVPFLTIPLADLLLSLPEEYLISQRGETKSVFRAAMRGIVPDDVLDRRDKIGFETPEKVWLLGMSPIVRGWLEEGADVPFLNKKALLNNFDLVAEGKAPFSWQLWRWINFVRWSQGTPKRGR
jgi:asparagine synthase (glutamine-hydrolysing)